MTKPIGKILLLLAAALALTTALAACGSDDASSTAATGTESSSTLKGDLTVFAAASLTDAFDEIGAAFMTENPDVKVTFNYAGSSDLVTQINEGAPVDVFASADKSNMTKLTDAGNNGGEPVMFAKNTPQIIVGAGNPKGITDGRRPGQGRQPRGHLRPRGTLRQVRRADSLQRQGHRDPQVPRAEREGRRDQGDGR